MASRPDALDLEELPPLVLEAPKTFGDCDNFYAQLDEALSHSRLVVVKGWKPQGLSEFSKEAFEAAGISRDHPVQCHSKFVLSSRPRIILKLSFRCQKALKAK